MGMILAGDVGGTKTNLALFEEGAARPAAFATYASADHEGLEAMVRDFLEQHPAQVERACFGVAGRVDGARVDTTNLAWPVDGALLARLLGLPAVSLVNDLEATAWGVAALPPASFAVLNEGDPQARGNAAVIAAGTGLGQAGLYWDGERHQPFATEGGHVDFAPRGELEVELYRFLAAELPHVSYERVCSGMGIVNLFRFLLQRAGKPEPAWFADANDRAAAVAAAADAGDELAEEALDRFCSIYGAQAGNLALTLMATGGVYVGGGIAPKLLPRLRSGRFLDAFLDKGRFRDLMAAIPVKVILDDRTAVYGAARCAASRSA